MPQHERQTSEQVYQRVLESLKTGAIAMPKQGQTLPQVLEQSGIAPVFRGFTKGLEYINKLPSLIKPWEGGLGNINQQKVEPIPTGAIADVGLPGMPKGFFSQAQKVL